MIRKSIVLMMVLSTPLFALESAGVAHCKARRAQINELIAVGDNVLVDAELTKISAAIQDRYSHGLYDVSYDTTNLNAPVLTEIITRLREIGYKVSWSPDMTDSGSSIFISW